MERFFTIVFCLLMIISSVLWAQTDSLRVSWDLNPESDMLEYRLYRAVNGPQNFQLLQTIAHPDTQTVDRSNIQPGSLYSFSLAAVDSAGNQSQFSDTISVGLPLINWTVSQIVNGGATTVPLQSFTSDPDHNVSELTYMMSNENNITVNRNGNDLILTPVPLSYTGSAGFTLRVEDPAGFWDIAAIQFTVVLPVNNPPQITSTPVTLDTVGNLYQYHVVASDPDPGDTLTYALIQSPAFLGIDSISGLISGTSSPSDTGNHPVSVQVFDQEAAADTQNYVLQIIKLPEPPVISNIPNQTIAEGDTFTQIVLDNYVSDPDDPDENLIWTYSGNTQLTVSIDVNRRARVAIPHPDWNGSETVTFRVTDPTGLFDTDNATFTVTPVNDPPQITSTPLTGATQGAPYTYAVTAIDPDTLDVLTFSLLTAPAFLTIDTQTGIISGMPAVSDTGTHNVNVKVQDQVAAADTQNYTLTVLFSNQPPAVSNIPDQIIAEGDQFTLISLDDFVADPESPDQDIIWSFSGNSELTVQIDPNRIATVSTPHLDWFGSEDVIFKALDPGGLSDEDTVSFTVTPVNDPPVLQLTQITLSQPQQNIIDLKQFVSDIDDSVMTMSWQFQNFIHFQLTWEDQINQLLRIDRLDSTSSETGAFLVSDPGGLSDTAQVTIIYQGTVVNTPPSLAQLPDQFLMEEDISYLISMEPYVKDSTHNIFELTFEFFPGMNLQAQYSWVTSELTLETALDWYGTTDLRIVVSDPGGLSDEKWVTIHTRPRVDLQDISFQFENENSVSVNLETDIPSEVDLSFWVTPTLKSSYKSNLFTLSHSFSLTNLLVDTTYQYSLTLTDTSGFQKIYSDSSFQTGAQQKIVADNNEVFVYPNPYRPSTGHSVVVFDNLPLEMTGLLVYSTDGQVVYERELNGVPMRRMPWSVINKNGENLASGLYIYIVKGENGKKIKAGKLAVIR